MVKGVTLDIPKKGTEIIPATMSHNVTSRETVLSRTSYVALTKYKGLFLLWM